MDQKFKILLVEDDDRLRGVLRDRFFKQCHVIEAIDGEAAIEACLDHHPDLILLDLLLPKLDGFKVLERIRTYPQSDISSTRVVVLSNLWSQKDILQVQGLKVDEYFVKAHTTIEDIVSRIQAIIEGMKVSKKG
ncbi:MAG: response regulator [Patescibacteria group bacterium]|nr:response regulator [Patescibacteria group bacterium]